MIMFFLLLNCYLYVSVGHFLAEIFERCVHFLVNLSRDYFQLTPLQRMKPVGKIVQGKAEREWHQQKIKATDRDRNHWYYVYVLIIEYAEIYSPTKQNSSC